MTSGRPNEPRVLLVAVSEPTSEPLEDLRASLEQAGLRVDGNDGRDGGADESPPEEPDAVAILGKPEAALAAARSLRRSYATVRIVFLVEPEHDEAFRRLMLLAPRVGTNWTSSPPDVLRATEAVREAARLTRRQRQHRTTLDRFGMRLQSATVRETSDLRKLVVSDRYLASILEYAPDAIVALDSRGDVLTWNGGAATQFGLPVERAVHRPLLALVTPEHHDVTRAALAAVLESETERRLEIECARSDGTRFPAELTLGRVELPNDDRRSAVAMIRDITSRRQAERVQREARAELEAKVEERTRELHHLNRELEAFSYSVSHDLRAPLRGITGFAQALVEDAADRLDDTERMYLKRIQSGTLRMSELIDAMLTLSRITRANLERKDVDLAALARDVMSELRSEHASRAIDFECPESLPVRGDRALLRVLLENLLSNAVKYTRNRDGACIAVDRRFEDDEIVYSVRDNGAGFDMKYADKLFVAFQRLHAQSDFEGIGIGLATVQRIVHRHGGRIWAEGSDGVGATFSFTLPDDPQVARSAPPTPHIGS